MSNNEIISDLVNLCITEYKKEILQEQWWKVIPALASRIRWQTQVEKDDPSIYKYLQLFLEKLNLTFEDLNITRFSTAVYCLLNYADEQFIGIDIKSEDIVCRKFADKGAKVIFMITMPDEINEVLWSQDNPERFEESTRKPGWYIQLPESILPDCYVAI